MFSPAHLTQYIQSLKETQVRRELIERKIRSLEVFYAWAKKKGVLSESEYDTLCMVIKDITKPPKPSSIEKKGPSQKKLSPYDTAIRYLVLALLILIPVVGVITYIFVSNQNIEEEKSVQIAAQPHSRDSISFQGVLKGKDGAPIEDKVDVVFRLYSKQDGGEALYTGNCVGAYGIEPDVEGRFSLEIGSDCNMEPIPQSVLQNSAVYVGMTVGKGKELSPRQRIVTVAYAKTSDNVKGLSVGSRANSIPYINEEGTISIQTDSPTLRSTNGLFTIEGEMLALQTTPGSGNSIILTPDIGGDTIISSGNVGIGMPSPGEKLEVAGNIGVRGNMLFRQTDALITNAAGLDMRLGDKNMGDLIIKPGGYISIGTVQQVEKITIGGNVAPSLDGEYTLGTKDNRWDAVHAQEFIGGTEGIQGYWRRVGDTLSTRFTNDDLFLGSKEDPLHGIKLSGKEGEASWINTGNVGIGTDTPDHTLSVVGYSGDVSVASITNLSPNDTSGTSALRLSLATPTTGVASHFMEFFAGATNEQDGTKVGGIRLDNNKVIYETNGGDFAEYFEIQGSVDTGDIIEINSGQNTRARSDGALLGVVTDAAGFVGNVQAKKTGKDTALVGLIGQVKTNISTLHGPIQRGDAISASDIPGFGARAQTEGYVVGKALESTSSLGSADLSSDLCPASSSKQRDPNGKPVACGKITVLVSVQWYNPGIEIAEDGSIRDSQDYETTQEYSYDGVLSDQSSLQTKIATRYLQVEKIVVDEFIEATQVVATNISTVSLTSQEVATDSLTALDAQISKLQAQEIVSPVITADTVDTERLQVDEITPHEDENDITIDIGSTEEDNPGELAQLMIQGIRDETVARIDEEGNASFRGEVESESVRTRDIEAENADISGSVRAKRVEAENIDELSKQVDNVSSSLDENSSSLSSLHDSYSSLVDNLNIIQQSLAQVSKQELPDNTQEEVKDLETYSIYPEETHSIITSSLQSEAYPSTMEDLVVTGNVNTYDLHVSHTAHFGKISVEDTSIIALAQDLNLSALSRVQFFAGQAEITKDGSIRTLGSITAEKGVYTPSLESADGQSGVQVDLDSETGEKFTIQNKQDNTPVASIDNEGRAAFSKIAVSSYQQATPSAIIITPTENEERNGIFSHAIETTTEAAGEGMLPRDVQEIVIYNSALTDASLVYLTPTSSSDSIIPLSVTEKNTCSQKNDGQCKAYFKVATNQRPDQDVTFNWLVIN